MTRRPRPRHATREEPARGFELDSIASRWQQALDAADRALTAAAPSLPAADVRQRRTELTDERRRTAELLRRVARASGIRPAPWLPPVTVSATSLGLDVSVGGAVFDLDGVLSDSGLLHAWAWGEVFDDLLLRLSEKTGWRAMRFDRDADYRAFLDGRSRLDGIHAFLASRGISLPEGRAGDAPDSDTAHGLAKRKSELLARRMRDRGVTALSGARRYLEAAGHAGLARAVVSASANTSLMLERAGLATLLEARIDADVMRAESLRPRPAPDVLLAACRRLEVLPENAVTFTHSPAGVAAGHAAGLAVVGVGDEARQELLQGFGAERTVPSLGTLLNRRLLDGGAR